jgi:hypothetical protein
MLRPTFPADVLRGMDAKLARTRRVLANCGYAEHEARPACLPPAKLQPLQDPIACPVRSSP